jgi:glycine cleavage system regulatory protein
MIRTPDSVFRQSLVVHCDSASDAASLRERLAGFNRARLLPVIERVLAEAASNDRRIHLDRLEVDLGTFSWEEVEAQAADRLYTALTAALREALNALPAQDSELSEAAWLSLLETYLLTGMLPFWTPDPESFSPGQLTMQLAKQQPAAAAAVFYRTGRQDNVLLRIVLQYLPEELAALIHLLEPANADLILAYTADIEATNRLEHLTRLSDSEFDRLLWLLVLRFLTLNSGSLFNRKLFVNTMLTGIADRAGVTYSTLLHIFAEALKKLASRLNPRFSLPAVIQELVEETAPGDHRLFDTSSAQAIDIGPPTDQNMPIEPNVDTHGLERWLSLSPDQANQFTEQDLADRLRRLIRNRETLQQFAPKLLPEQFAAVVRLLDPEHAAVILAYTADIVSFVPLEVLALPRAPEFEILLRILIFTYLTREPDYQFTPYAFVRMLIEGLAKQSGTSSERILSILNRTADRLLFRSSLPGVLRTLLQESQVAQHAVLRNTLSSLESMGDLRARLSQLLPSLSTQGSPLAAALETALSQVSDQKGLLERLLTTVQQGENLDLERLVSETNSAPTRSRPMSLDELQTALDAKIHSTEPDRLAFASLLEELLERDPHVARRFLRSRFDRYPQRKSIIESLDPTRMPRLLELLSGRSDWLQPLLEACLQLPLPYRPGWQKMHEIVLNELLYKESVDASDPALLNSLLFAIFPAPLPEPVRIALLERLSASHANLTTLLSSNPTELANPASHAVNSVDASLLLDKIFATSSDTNAHNKILHRFEDLLRELENSSSSRSTELRRALRLQLADPAQRKRFIRLLPQEKLTRFLEALEPGRAAVLLSGARLLATALPRSSEAAYTEDHVAFWDRVFETVTDPATSPGLHLDILLSKYLAAAELQTSSTSSAAKSDGTHALLLEAERLAKDAGHAALQAALQRRRHASNLLTSINEPVRTRPASPSRATKRRIESVSTAEESLYIPNAGLVITSAFLPHLFQQLNFLEPANPGRSRWRDPDTASRAVHLMQYLVDGRTSTPEPRLLFNKVLCGLDPATPIARSIDLTGAEEEACNALLAAILANWTTISTSSVEALRETFLQRQGKLKLVPEHNTLQVERKTVDVLADRIPWNFHLVFSPWMAEPLHVIW